MKKLKVIAIIPSIKCMSLKLLQYLCLVLPVSAILLTTGCQKRDVSTLSKSIIGVWRVGPDDDFCLYYDSTTLTQVHKREGGKVEKSVMQYSVISSSESENSLTIGVYEKSDADFRHRRKIKFTNLDRDSFIEEIKVEKPILGLDVGWIEGSRYHYEGADLP